MIGTVIDVRRLPRVRCKTAKGRLYHYFHAGKVDGKEVLLKLPDPAAPEFATKYAELHQLFFSGAVLPAIEERVLLNPRQDPAYVAFLKSAKRLQERGLLNRPVRLRKKRTIIAERFVYFIDGDVGLIKIGLTTEPERRLKTMQTGSPIPLRIMAVVSGQRAVEKAYHKQFAKHRAHGEWFDRCPAILAEIERLNAPERERGSELFCGSSPLFRENLADFARNSTIQRENR